MLEIKLPRLLAAAKEFNVGQDTIVDFLVGKGFNRDDLKPTAKLSEDMYRSLQHQFEGDKASKNKADLVEIPKGIQQEGRRVRDEEEITFGRKYKDSSNDIPPELIAEQTALARIMECLSNKSNALNLSGLGLKNIPAQIVECQQLDSLDLSENSISNIGLLEKLKKLRYLNLNGNKLRDIRALFELKSLQILILSRNNVGDLSPLNDFNDLLKLDISENNIVGDINLPNKYNLRTLNISRNRISNLKGLHCKQLRILEANENLLVDIQGLLGLKELEIFKASNNLLEEIFPIGSCQRLKVLDLTSNQIREIKTLSTCLKLEVLLLASNQINNITPLSFCKHLKRLDLSGNYISDITVLKDKSLLKSVNLSNNKLEISCIKVFQLLLENSNNNLKEIKIGGNKLDIIVKDNSESGENHLPLIHEYLQRVNSDIRVSTVPLRLIQLLVLGNGEVGKTSVLKTIKNTYGTLENKKVSVLNTHIPPLPSGSTHGNIHHYWKLNLKTTNNKEEQYTLLVKDFGGQEYYHQMHPLFYNTKALYWIVNAPESYDEKTPLENGNFSPAYWVKNIYHYLNYHHGSNSNDSPQIWLINNKIDLPGSNRDFHYNSNYFDKIFNLASLNREELDKLQQTTRNKYLNTQQSLYYELTENIEAISTKERIYTFSSEIFNKLLKLSPEEKKKQLTFTKEAFAKYLCGVLKFDPDIINKNIETIVHELKYLGLCLNISRNSKLKNLIFLHPKELSEFVFDKILRLDIIEKKDGELDLEILNQYGHIKELLRHFEIIFEDNRSKKWIVPQYLPKVSPDNDLIAIASVGLNKQLYIRFNDFMPQGIMSRLICYFGGNPNRKWYWRYGIFFTEIQEDGMMQKALIKAKWENEFSIIIKAESNKHLEIIFTKVLLSFFNEPIDLLDDLKEDESKWLEKIKEEFIDISLSLNSSPLVPLKEFKKWIDAEAATFYYLSDDAESNVELEPEAPLSLVKIHEFLPFLNYLLDTSKFSKILHPKKLFISYSHKDSEVRTEIQSHLRLMERAGILSTWYDLMIEEGTNWDDKILFELETADIILLLISNNFFSSEYIWKKELEVINRRLQNGNVLIIPILCRHCIWGIKEPFKSALKEDYIGFNIESMQALPINKHTKKITPIFSEDFPFIEEPYSQIAEKLFEMISKQ